MALLQFKAPVAYDDDQSMYFNASAAAMDANYEQLPSRTSCTTTKLRNGRTLQMACWT